MFEWLAEPVDYGSLMVILLVAGLIRGIVEGLENR